MDRWIGGVGKENEEEKDEALAREAKKKNIEKKAEGK